METPKSHSQKLAEKLAPKQSSLSVEGLRKEVEASAYYTPFSRSAVEYLLKEHDRLRKKIAAFHVAANNVPEPYQTEMWDNYHRYCREHGLDKEVDQEPLSE